MVGQGVLRECLVNPEVEKVLSVGRNPSGRQSPKLDEIVRKDLLDYSGAEAELTGFDACFFCLGVTSVGMSEERYRQITHDIALAAARELVRRNPTMTFVFVSGMGADSSGAGPVMWARVKGETENDLIAVGFPAVYIFRPGAIVPMHGIRSKTWLYRVFYGVLGPILPLLMRWFPKYVTSTERVGKAMIRVVKRGGAQRILENGDINELGK